MRKLSEINEGMFSGIIRRSNSEHVKKEDDIEINNMDIYDFKDYLESQYKPIYNKFFKNEKFFIDTESSSSKYIYMGIPISCYSFLYVNYKKSDLKKIVSLEMHINKRTFPNLKAILRQYYNIIDGSCMYIRSKNNDLSNESVINIIDLIIDNIDNKNELSLKKRI